MTDEGEEVVEDTEWEVPDEQLTAEEVFIKYDTDHSGAIDMDEFKVRSGTRFAPINHVAVGTGSADGGGKRAGGGGGGGRCRSRTLLNSPSLR
jgi:hypothetical protein